MNERISDLEFLRKENTNRKNAKIEVDEANEWIRFVGELKENMLTSHSSRGEHARVSTTLARQGGVLCTKNLSYIA